MKKIILPALLIVVTALSACNDAAKTDGSKNESTSVATTDTSAKFDLAGSRSLIDADNAKFIDAIKKGDSNAVADLYHSEAQVLMSNYEPVMRKDIASAWGGMFRMGLKDAKFTTTDLVGNNDLLVETGMYEMYGDKNNLIDKGKYVSVWKKENGAWKLYRDIANTSMPVKKK